MLALGLSAYTKDAAFNMEKNSVECTVNDDSVQVPCKNLSASKTSLFLLFLKTKATCIICRKESRGFATFEIPSRETFDMSWVIYKHI